MRIMASKWPNWLATAPGLPSTSSIEEGHAPASWQKWERQIPPGDVHQRADAITGGLLASCDWAH